MNITPPTTPPSSDCNGMVNKVESTSAPVFVPGGETINYCGNNAFKSSFSFNPNVDDFVPIFVPQQQQMGGNNVGVNCVGVVPVMNNNNNVMVASTSAPAMIPNNNNMNNLPAGSDMIMTVSTPCYQQQQQIQIPQQQQIQIPQQQQINQMNNNNNAPRYNNNGAIITGNNNNNNNNINIKQSTIIINNNKLIIMSLSP